MDENEESFICTSPETVQLVSGTTSSLIPETSNSIYSNAFEMFIPEAMFESLKCCLCDGYLSVFPVNARENGDLVCGRCTPDTDVFLLRQTAYETLASCVLFPCTYKCFGCKVYALPSRVGAHEEKCQYRNSANCYETECNFVGSLAQLSKHYDATHYHLFGNAGKEFDLTFTDKHNYYDVLFESSYGYFRFNLMSTGGKVSIRPYVLHHDEAFVNYSFVIMYDFESGDINVCTFNVQHDQPQQVHEIPLKNNRITFNIKIKPFDGKRNVYRSVGGIAEKLICSHCGKYIYRNFYTCDCLPTNVYCGDYCTECQKERQLNLFIASIASDVMYECLNDSCDSILEYSELPDHESRCKYRPFCCRICAKTLGNFDMLKEHLVEKHDVVQKRIVHKTIFIYPNSIIEIGDNQVFYLMMTVDEYINFKLMVDTPDVIGSNDYLFELVLRNDIGDVIYLTIKEDVSVSKDIVNKSIEWWSHEIVGIRKIL